MEKEDDFDMEAYIKWRQENPDADEPGAAGNDDDDEDDEDYDDEEDEDEDDDDEDDG